jgi:hypothetical protein
MKVLQSFEQKICSQIRDELAIKPVITMTALKERIEKVFGAVSTTNTSAGLLAKSATRS